MKPIKNFSIFKNNKKEKDTHPDYTISAKIEKNNTEEFKEIGAVYLKETTKGEKYFSCGLAKERQYNDNTYDGYVIITERQYQALKQAYDDWQIKKDNPDYPTPTEQGIIASRAMQPDTSHADITPEMLDVDPNDIPFD
jgi:hypothetical protein